MYARVLTWLKPRRLELMLSLGFVLIYALAFPLLYQTLNHGALHLALPGVALLSWALGLAGALGVGLAMPLLHLGLLQASGVPWDSSPQDVMLVVGRWAC